MHPIVLYGDPVLRRKAEPVASITRETRAVLDDMMETMYAEPGVGLAAPQIGVSLRLMVIDLSVGKDPRQLVKMVNPKVIFTAGRQTGEEGCLSFPGIFLDVTRPDHARVEALDEHGRPLCIEGRGFMARALLHEYDHIEGRLFIDHVGLLRREQVKREIKRLQREGLWHPRSAGAAAAASWA
jgi:peptide deformylase